jgi:hypothetical protein
MNELTTPILLAYRTSMQAQEHDAAAAIYTAAASAVVIREMPDLWNLANTEMQNTEMVFNDAIEADRFNAQQATAVETTRRIKLQLGQAIRGDDKLDRDGLLQYARQREEITHVKILTVQVQMLDSFHFGVSIDDEHNTVNHLKQSIKR